MNNHSKGNGKGDTSFNLSLAGGKLEVEVQGELHTLVKDSNGNHVFQRDNIMPKRKLSDFGVAVYDEKGKNITVRDIDGVNPNTHIPAGHQFEDISAVKTELERVYDQAVFSWNIIRKSKITIDYDANGNGQLDLDEMDTIFDDPRVQDSNSINILVVKDGLLFSGAVKNLGENSAIVTIGSGIYYTVAHEVGHTLSLRHINADDENTLFSGFIFYQPENLMSNLSFLNPLRNIKLLKKQWDRIRNHN